jgi:penicillin amidase
LLATGVEAAASRLLAGDPHGWFRNDDRREKIRAAMQAALKTLAERLGADMSKWTWGRLHTLRLRHVLSSRGQLGELLDSDGRGVDGDMGTVCNTGSAPDWSANTGAGYRLVVDLAAAPPELLAVDVQSQSGQPGSPHWDDQCDDWRAGRYHAIPLGRDAAAAGAIHTLFLRPARST